MISLLKPRSQDTWRKRGGEEIMSGAIMNSMGGYFRSRHYSIPALNLSHISVGLTHHPLIAFTFSRCLPALITQLNTA